MNVFMGAVHTGHAEVGEADVAFTINEDVACLDVARHQEGRKKIPVEEIGIM